MFDGDLLYCQTIPIERKHYLGGNVKKPARSEIFSTNI